jgi:DUF1365 family protein
VSDAARLYLSEVMHRRARPVRYRFVYRVYSLLVDIDRLDELQRLSSVFSHNRFNLLGFHDRDHGPRDGSPLRPWLDATLHRFGVDLEGGRVELLCFPRVLGYVFNPLSIWYCRHRDGSLRAVLLQVSNTFGEWHGYVLHDGGRALDWPVRQSRSKVFHVSPFIDMSAEYHFRLSEPAERLEVTIREYQRGEPMLTAAQVGAARSFDTRNLLSAFARVPLLSFKVMALIHWQALKIWLKGARFYGKPTPPPQEVS